MRNFIISSMLALLLSAPYETNLSSAVMAQKPSQNSSEKELDSSVDANEQKSEKNATNQLNDKDQKYMTKKITQTAGRNALGEFAPKFAHYNDDVLFGENWNNQDIDLKTRSVVTVVALVSSGITDSSLKFHLQNAKNHGVSQKEIAAIITHTAFYAGWPKAWAAFNMAKEVWEVNEGDLPYEEEAMRAHAKEMPFPIGAPNDAYAKYFSGRSFLAPISASQVRISNVTFEPGCRNNWHIHHAKNGGGQILVCVAGEGWYQEEGKNAIFMKPGDCVNIKTGVKHWHGAAADSWFSHLAIEIPGEETSNEWLEPVSDEEYSKLNQPSNK